MGAGSGGRRREPAPTEARVSSSRWRGRPGPREEIAATTSEAWRKEQQLPAKPPALEKRVRTRRRLPASRKSPHSRRPHLRARAHTPAHTRARMHTRAHTHVRTHTCAPLPRPTPAALGPWPRPRNARLTARKAPSGSQRGRGFPQLHPAGLASSSQRSPPTQKSKTLRTRERKGCQHQVH